MLAIEVLVAALSRNRALSFCDCYEMQEIPAIATERRHSLALDLVQNSLPQPVRSQ